MSKNRGLKTYTVERVKIKYKDEELYDGTTYSMPNLENLAEDLALEFYEDKAEEIPDEEFEIKCAEILAELKENAEYYEGEEVDDNYYLEQEYWASVL